jgi:hypothetical protein
MAIKRRASVSICQYVRGQIRDKFFKRLDFMLAWPTGEAGLKIEDNKDLLLLTSLMPRV